MLQPKPTQQTKNRPGMSVLFAVQELAGAALLLPSLGAPAPGGEEEEESCFASPENRGVGGAR